MSVLTEIHNRGVNDREITIQQNKNGEEQANLEITAARTVSFPSMVLPNIKTARIHLSSNLAE
ncbi:MAG: hypothetical protein LVT47_05055 [Cyanobacteria bacterium LVE1205-1]